MAEVVRLRSRSGTATRVAVAATFLLVASNLVHGAASPARAASGVPSSAHLTWTEVVNFPEPEAVASTTTIGNWDTWLASDRIEPGESVAFKETWQTDRSSVWRYPPACNPPPSQNTSIGLERFSLLHAPYDPRNPINFEEFFVQNGTEATFFTAKCYSDTTIKTFTGTIPGDETAQLQGCFVLTPQGSGPATTGEFSGTAASIAIGVDPATCSPDNHPPVAVDDGVIDVDVVPLSMSGDPSLSVRVSPMDNDSDPDGDPITLVSATPAVHGRTWIDPEFPESVRYLPEAGYVGDDAFLYTISDDKGLTAQGQVNLNVTGVLASNDELQACGESQIAAHYQGEWVAREELLSGTAIDTLHFRVSFDWCYGDGSVFLVGQPEVEQKVGDWVLPEWFQPIKFRADDSVAFAQWASTSPDTAAVHAGGRFEACVNAIEILFLVAGLKIKVGGTVLKDPFGGETLAKTLQESKWLPRKLQAAVFRRIFNALKLWTIDATGVALGAGRTIGVDPGRKLILEALGLLYDASVDKIVGYLMNEGADKLTESQGLFDACEETWLPDVTIPLQSSGILQPVSLGDRFDPFWSLKQVAP